MLGIPAEMVAETVTALEQRKKQDGEAFGVWCANKGAINRFLACATQWRAAAAGLGGIVWVGFDYGACSTVLAGQGMDMTPAQWSDLQQMEAAALHVMNGGTPEDAS